jgi:hypothetical protein
MALRLVVRWSLVDGPTDRSCVSRPTRPNWGVETLQRLRKHGLGLLGRQMVWELECLELYG